MPSIQFENLARIAVCCSSCFDTRKLSRPRPQDLAQPRWIGPEYWNADPKVLLLMTNPGDGRITETLAHARRVELLSAFRDRQTGIEAVFADQRRDMEYWGRVPGVFTNFVERGLGLKLNALAIMNVAWCATRGNVYPKDEILDPCFKKFSRAAIKLLSPDIIILSGGASHQYQRQISELLPSCKVLKALHYAHRKGRATELAECKAIREALRIADGVAP